MKQIVTADGEMNAAIIKGFLESNGIKSSYGPRGAHTKMGSPGPNQGQHIFVDEKDADLALKLLKDQGLIS